MIKHTKSNHIFFVLVVCGSFLLAGCGTRSVVTPPTQPTRDPIDERKLEQQLEAMNPAAVPVFQDATRAMDSGDSAKAKQLYEQVISMAPEFSTAYRRLGYIELGSNNIPRAEEVSRKALELESNSFNQSSVVWLLGLGVLFVVGTLLSRATLQTLNKATLAANVPVKPEESRIRSIYRAVITILSIYFYISIPFVILILLLVVGGAFYIFLSIGTIPIQLSVILVIMLVASLFALLRSVFLRRKELPPGRPLRRMDAPELWKLVEEVAQKLEVRPADAIYVTPWTGIAVNEKGTILQKLRGAGKRNLILGMGVLPGLTQSQLAAILAHEYGHFSNRDTAGGNLAHQVYASLTQIAEGLMRSGAALVYNPVWWFVMTYQRIFLRVTLGASRLQEVLADRYAALTYGSQNFIDGLQSIIRESVSFPLRADAEIRRSLEVKQPVNNLYELPLDANLQGELQKQVDEVMNRKTSQYDSHPAPHERIAWVERMHIPFSPVLENRSPALYLFPNPEELQREMTTELMKHVVTKG